MLTLGRSGPDGLGEGVADDDREPNGVRYTTREMFDEIRKDIAGMRDEMRSTRHDLAGKLATVALRVDRLEYQQADTMRRLEEHDGLAAEHVPRLEKLLADQSLADRMKQAGWTRKERVMAYGLFVFALIGALGTILTMLVLYRGG